MTVAASILRIIDSARMNLPGALEGAIRMELFNVLKELTQATNIWQEELAFVVGPGVYDYPIASGQSGAFINRLLWVEGKRVDVAVPESGAAQRGYLLEPGVGTVVIRIPTPPNENETWYAHVGLTIADPTTSDGLPYSPDWIVDKYHSLILEGLLARMMAQPAKPYSNSQGALFNGRRFRNGIGKVRSEVSHGFTFKGNNWRFPRSFKVYR